MSKKLKTGHWSLVTEKLSTIHYQLSTAYYFVGLIAHKKVGNAHPTRELS